MLSRQHPEDDPIPAGRVHYRGEDVNEWADGTGNELMQRQGCTVSAEGPRSTPQRVALTCPTCRSSGDRQCVQRTWPRLVALLDAAQAQELNLTRLALRD